MISLRQLLEQIDLPQPENTEDGFDAEVNDTSAELDNGTITLETYIDKLTQHLNATNSNKLALISPKKEYAHLGSIQDQITSFFDQSSDSVKSQLYNQIGTITAKADDVDAMNSQIKTNIYLTNPGLTNIGIGVDHAGAGEFSFVVAHSRATWAGKTATGDAELDGFIIDVKDEKKISKKVPGVDIPNKTKYKLFFDNTKFLELQKKVELMLKFIRAYDSYSTRMNIFDNQKTTSEFLNVRNYFIKLFSGDYSYTDWLRQMQRLNRENGITLSIDDSDTSKQRNQRLLIIAQKGGHDTLKFQCFLNKLSNFINRNYENINDSTVYGKTLKSVANDKIFEPNWFIHTLQDSIKLDDLEYLDNLTYDYILIASKAGDPPMYFRSQKQDSVVVSLYAKRGINVAGPFGPNDKKQTGPDALIMNFNDYLDTITYNDLSGVDPCNFDKASGANKAKAVQYLVRNNK
jgi:hypothetical protein